MYVCVRACERGSERESACVRVCVRECVLSHVYTYAHTHTRTHTNFLARTRALSLSYMHTKKLCIDVCMYAHMFLCMYVACMHACVHMYVRAKILIVYMNASRMPSKPSFAKGQDTKHLQRPYIQEVETHKQYPAPMLLRTCSVFIIYTYVRGIQAYMHIYMHAKVAYTNACTYSYT